MVYAYGFKGLLLPCLTIAPKGYGMDVSFAFTSYDPDTETYTLPCGRVIAVSQDYLRTPDPGADCIECPYNNGEIIAPFYRYSIMVVDSLVKIVFGVVHSEDYKNPGEVIRFKRKIYDALTRVQFPVSMISILMQVH